MNKKLIIYSGILGVICASLIAIFVGFEAFISFSFAWVSFGGILLSSMTHLKLMLKQESSNQPPSFVSRFGTGLKLSFAPWRIVSYAVFIAGMIVLLEYDYFHILAVLGGVALSVMMMLFIGINEISS